MKSWWAKIMYNRDRFICCRRREFVEPDTQVRGSGQLDKFADVGRVENDALRVQPDLGVGVDSAFVGLTYSRRRLPTDNRARRRPTTYKKMSY
jgi:hypothetical protein